MSCFQQLISLNPEQFEVFKCAYRNIIESLQCGREFLNIVEGGPGKVHSLLLLIRTFKRPNYFIAIFLSFERLGSGKTHILLNLILAFALGAQEKESSLKILVTASSDIAVDQIADKFHKAYNKLRDGKYFKKFILS